jgi:hypothetical protein
MTPMLPPAFIDEGHCITVLSDPTDLRIAEKHHIWLSVIRDWWNHGCPVPLNHWEPNDRYPLQEPQPGNPFSESQVGQLVKSVLQGDST